MWRVLAFLAGLAICTATPDYGTDARALTSPDYHYGEVDGIRTGVVMVVGLAVLVLISNTGNRLFAMVLAFGAMYLISADDVWIRLVGVAENASLFAFVAVDQWRSNVWVAVERVGIVSALVAFFAFSWRSRGVSQDRIRGPNTEERFDLEGRKPIF